MWKPKLNLLFPLFLVLVTMILTTKGINSGEFWWTDDSRHAMDGVFLLDFIKDFPLDDIYGYTERYFAKYPALGLTWYPPFFALVEALFFGIFGISEISARATVVIFTVMATIIWYVFVRKVFDEKIAFFSSLLLITTPEVVFWAREVMLELPALTLIVLSCYFFYNHFVLGKQRHIYYLTLSLVFALYIKQTNLFIIPLFFSYTLMRSQFNKLLAKRVFLCGILFILAIVPLVIFTIKFGTTGLAASFGNLHELRGGSSRSSLQHWTAYFKLFPQIFTWPALILAIFSLIGFIGNFIKTKQYDEMMLFFIIWIFWWYISFSTLGAATTRYGIYAVPALAAMAVWPMKFLRSKAAYRWVSTAILSLTCFYQASISYGQTRYYVRGYEEAAKYVMKNYKGKTILFSGYHNGNFIFYARKYDPQRKAVILRASKILISMSVYKNWGYRSYVNCEQDIYDILNRYGTKFIVVEDQDLIGAPPLHTLRELLKTENFTLVKKIKIDSNIDKYSSLSLLIYEYNSNNEPKNLTENLIIKFPLLKREINLPIQSLVKDDNVFHSR